MERLNSFWLFAASLVLYTGFATPVFIGGDHILFTFVGVDGGYAHAPGYPLYSLLCRLFVTVLPLDPIHATSVGTAFIAALAIVAFYKGLQAWRIDSRFAAFGAAIFGLMPHVMVMHTQAEVFALNHLFAALILWACAATTTSVWKTGLLGLLAGIALSHHHTIVFLAPLGLWTVYRHVRTSDRPGVTLMLGVAGLLLGLSPYLYLTFTAMKTPAPWHWGDPTTVSGLLDIFLRRDFGTLSMTVAEGDGQSSVFEQWGFLAQSVAHEVVGVGLLVGAWGGIHLWRKNRGLAIATGLSLLLSGPIFVALFHRSPEGLNELLVKKFHLLFLWNFSILIACGLEASFFKFTRIMGAVLFVWVFVAIVLGGRALLETHDNAPSLFIRDLWAPIPPNAVLIASGDHVTAGSWEYLAEHDPTSFTIAAHLLAHSWYRDQVNTALGISTEHTDEKVDLEELIDAIHASGRPVFMSSILNPKLARIYPTYPFGLVIAVAPRGGIGLKPMEAAAQNARIFGTFEYDGPEHHAGPWADQVAKAYAAPWAMLATTFENLGDSTSAAQAATMRDRYTARAQK